MSNIVELLKAEQEKNAAYKPFFDKIAEETMNLLLMQINERKKRRPKPLEAPVHKVLTPVLVRRETTN